MKDGIENKNNIKNKSEYRMAVDFLSGYNGKINSLSNQLNFLIAPSYQSTLLSAISGMQSQLSTFNSFIGMLPRFDNLAALSPVLELSRNATLAFSRLSTLDNVKSLASVVSKNYTPWYNETIAKNSLLAGSGISTGIEIAKSSHLLSDLIGSQNLSAFSVQSSFAKATEFSLFAEKSLSTFTWADIGSRIGLNDISKSKISESFLRLSTDYSGLLKSFGSNPSSFIEISPSLTKLAPIEYFSGANFLEMISVEKDIATEEELLKNEIQYENEYSLNLYLPKIHSGLLSMWKGAIETYNSNNSDKVRQFTVSIRELFGHLMYQLAPDDKVAKWSTDPSHYDNGKLTRAARLHYICRNISSKPFNKFVEKDIKATIEFISIFQEGTHNIESSFTPQQLVAIKSKAETTLKFLLEIEFSTNN
jgi:hypothetical protein